MRELQSQLTEGQHELASLNDQNQQLNNQLSSQEAKLIKVRGRREGRSEESRDEGGRGEGEGRREEGGKVEKGGGKKAVITCNFPQGGKKGKREIARTVSNL